MITYLLGDCKETLKTLPDQSVHCCVCSPPYWNLRDYDVDGQLGLEKTPEQYVENMVSVFREVRRVLRDDGTLWLVIGDSYARGKVGRSDEDEASLRRRNQEWGTALRAKGGERGASAGRERGVPEGFKAKDLVGIPWMTAFALRADGWYLRSDIVWSKPNCMPSSVTDRPTCSHEYVFLLAKSERYFFDSHAIAEDAVSTENRGGGHKLQQLVAGEGAKNDGFAERWQPTGKRNKRTVWTVATQSYAGGHFATYPPELIRPCILAGSSEKCCSACGSPWERVVEKETLNLSNAAKAGTEIEGKGHVSTQVRDGHDVRNGPTTFTRTVGWEPSCECGATTKPCTVLDPFGGSGTTALVAEQEGRNAVLIELNPDYMELAKQRTQQASLLAG